MKLSLDVGKFFSLFPDGKTGNDKVTYTVEGSDYRVYEPKWNGDDMQIKIDHIRGGATDDHVELTLSFDDRNAAFARIGKAIAERIAV